MWLRARYRSGLCHIPSRARSRRAFERTADQFAMKDRPLRCMTRRLGDVVGFVRARGSGAVVLDVGCGKGVALQQLARRCPRCEAIGMSRGATAGQRPATARVRYVYGDAGVSIPLPTASVDLVVSISTLRFVRDKAKLLEEGWRVLRPGGEMRLKIVSEVGDQHGEYSRELICTVADGSGGAPISLRRYVLRYLPRDVDVQWIDAVGGGGGGARYVRFRKQQRARPLALQLRLLPARRGDACLDHGYCFSRYRFTALRFPAPWRKRQRGNYVR